MTATHAEANVNLKFTSLPAEEVLPTDHSIVNCMISGGEAWITVLDIAKATYPILYPSSRRPHKDGRKRIKDCIRNLEYRNLDKDDEMFCWMVALSAPSPMGESKQNYIRVLKWSNLEEALVMIMTKLVP